MCIADVERNQLKVFFCPGHDQRLRTDLERRVGGLIFLRMLVEAAEQFVEGNIGGSRFNGMVKELFKILMYHINTDAPKYAP